MRRSPRKAVPCGHRNGASLSATDASNPAAWRRGSTHPDHCMRGRIRLLTAGDHRNANGSGLLRRGACAYGEPRIGSSGQTGSGKRYERFSAPQELRSCRACSDRTPSMGCASVGHRDSGSPINKRERNVRRILLATPMRLVRNVNELRSYAGSHGRKRRRASAARPMHMDFGASEIGPPHRWAPSVPLASNADKARQTCKWASVFSPTPTAHDGQ